MNKELYLNKLRKVLEDEFVRSDDINQIIADYDDLYSQGLEQGLTDNEVVEKLGDAKFVYRSLKDDLNHHYKNGKATGVMVFIALILFFLSGRLLDAWQYSWMFFLLIPITGIVTNVRGRKILPALAVFGSIIIFYILGMKFGLWHPGWLIFLSIPISGIFASKSNPKMLMSITPFVILLTYFIISFYYPSFYLYGWPIFLLIPLIGSLYIEKPVERYLLFSSLVVSIIIYYILSVLLTNWTYPLFIFVIPFVIAIYTKRLKITSSLKYPKNAFVISSILIVVTTYLLVSFISKGWSWTWIILIAIPMIGIYAGNGFKNVVAYSPFIALILFFLVGTFIDDGYQYSWMFFLLIPISGILFGDKNIVSVKKNSDDFESEDDED